MNEKYLASEDSALLRGVLGEFVGENALEIGSGNGGNLVALASRFKTVVGTDIITPAMTDWRVFGTNFVMTDTASCMRPHFFDLVAFNPPYLSGNPYDDPATNGGSAFEVPLKFLRAALQVVKPEGTIVMLLNHEAPMSQFEAECTRYGFRMMRVAEKHLFFEELAVYVAFRADRREHDTGLAGNIGEQHDPRSTNFSTAS